VHFKIEQRFEVGVDIVQDTLCDPGFVDRMGTLPKLGQPKLLSHTVEGSTIHQQIRYAFAGDLSPAVRRVVDPAKLTWIEDSTIDRVTHRTEFRILPDNYAGLLHCDGTFTLSPLGATSSLRVAAGTIRVTVPFVGGKVEQAIVSGLEEHARAEVGLVEEWAAQRPS